MVQTFVEHPVESEYVGYIVPTMEQLCIERDGCVWDAKTRLPFASKRSGDYRCVNPPGMGSLHTHRLLAMTFLVCPGPFEDYVVNHLDGNKDNNSIDNLEWVSWSDNLNHAYEIGLRTDNLRILVKDLRTDEVSEFVSLQACARHFGVNGASIHHALRWVHPRPFQKYYALTVKGAEFPGLTREHIGTTGYTMPKAVVAATEEGVKIFEDAKQASELVGCPYPNLIYHLHKARKKGISSDYHGYWWCYLKDYNGDISNAIRHEKLKIHGFPTKDGQRIVRKPVPIRVTNRWTKETRDWLSVQAFAESVGQKKATIQKAIHRKNGWNVFHIEYIAH